jgi:hypothetical protein
MAHASADVVCHRHRVLDDVDAKRTSAETLGGFSRSPCSVCCAILLSHACWLIAYPLAGQVGARYGMRAAFVVLACVSVVGFLAAWRVWPAANHEDTVPVR